MILAYPSRDLYPRRVGRGQSLASRIDGRDRAMTKEITLARFFEEITLPDGSGIYGGNGERLGYADDGIRLIDGLGRFGYWPHFGGGWICYTCGAVCCCFDGEE